MTPLNYTKLAQKLQSVFDYYFESYHIRLVVIEPVTNYWLLEFTTSIWESEFLLNLTNTNIKEHINNLTDWINRTGLPLKKWETCSNEILVLLNEYL